MNELFNQISKLIDIEKYADATELYNNSDETEQTSDVTSLAAVAYNNLRTDEDYKKAIELLLSVEGKTSNEPKLYCRLCYAYYALKEYQNCIDVGKKALSFIEGLDEENTATVKTFLENSEDKLGKHVVITIDDVMAITDDYWNLIDPMWYGIDIYSSYEKYQEDMTKFTRPQQLLFAVQWFICEVWNGGICQFFINSTGIVWKDAYEGFEAIGLTHIKENFQSILKEIGEEPKFDQEERMAQFERLMPNMDDFYNLNDISDELYGQDEEDTQIIINYIKQNAKEFIFDGIIKK